MDEEAYKKRRREAVARYRARHPDRIKEQRKKFFSDPEKKAAYNEAQKLRARKRRAKNPEADREYQSAWRKANPDKAKAHTMKSVHGITPEEKEELFNSQGRACAICRSKKPSSSVGWVIDHCHVAGYKRGILCASCNSLLGFARDRVSILEAAINYLKR